MTSNPTRRQVQRVLLITLILNLAVAIGKIIVGTVSGALAITADGFHSLIDGSSNVIGLIANRIAQRPPDADHPYGHRRFETLAALFIGGFLILVGWEITTSAVERLRNPAALDVTPLMFGVLLATLVVNIGVSTYQIGQGKRLRSELLLADAANTRADVFVTLSVIVSLVVVALTGWTWIDGAAALVVVALIGHAAWRIFQQTARVLVDTAPHDPQRLAALVAAHPAVERVIRARSRGPIDETYIDIDVQVAPSTTADQTAGITGDIRQCLENALMGIAEVEVHFVPGTIDEADYPLRVQAVAGGLCLRTHEVFVSEGAHGRALDMHVEVPADLTLGEAHRLVSQLEASIRLQMPEIHEIVSHIEPTDPGALSEHLLPAAEREPIERRALSLLANAYPHVDWHHLRLYSGPDGLSLTLHAALPASESAANAHQMVEQAETLLRMHIAGLCRVTIHAEPYEHQK